MQAVLLRTRRVFELVDPKALWWRSLRTAGTNRASLETWTVNRERVRKHKTAWRTSPEFVSIVKNNAVGSFAVHS